MVSDDVSKGGLMLSVILVHLPSTEELNDLGRGVLFRSPSSIPSANSLPYLFADLIVGETVINEVLEGFINFVGSEGPCRKM